MQLHCSSHLAAPSASGRGLHCGASRLLLRGEGQRPQHRGTACKWAERSRHEPSTPDGPRRASPPGEEPGAHAAEHSPTSSRQLINQLLQIQSVASIDLPDAASDPHLTAAHEQQQQQQQQRAVAADPPDTLFEDPAAEEYDPMMLDVLSFTSVRQYLDSKLGASLRGAKVSLAGLAAWGALTAALMGPLGGDGACAPNMLALTNGGAEMDNLAFVWMGLFAYWTAKGCVMSGVTGLRAWVLQGSQQEALDELAETVEPKDQRRAFWVLQERLQAAQERANRTYAEFALASLLLGVLLLLRGGLDDVALQAEALDQDAFSRMLVMMWLLWESYFALVGASVKLIQLVTDFINRWHHQQKWGRASGGGGARDRTKP